MGEGDQGRRHRGKLSVRAARDILGWVLLATLAAAPAPAVAQQKKMQREAPPPKVEKLACKLGTEDHHARIAVELQDGKVNRFAYYSKWKPRTCSLEVKRDDAYSKWEDTGNVTVVTLFEDNGAFLIDHERNHYHFIFRTIDRMRYCGMEGKMSGSLTIFRGKPQCQLTGLMDRGEDAIQDAGKVPSQPAMTPVSADGSRK